MACIEGCVIMRPVPRISSAVFSGIVPSRPVPFRKIGIPLKVDTHIYARVRIQTFADETTPIQHLFMDCQ